MHNFNSKACFYVSENNSGFKILLFLWNLVVKYLSLPGQKYFRSIIIHNYSFMNILELEFFSAWFARHPNQWSRSEI